MYIYIYIYIRVCMYVCIYIYIYIYMYVCMYVCMCVCVCLGVVAQVGGLAHPGLSRSHGPSRVAAIDAALGRPRAGSSSGPAALRWLLALHWRVWVGVWRCVYAYLLARHCCCVLAHLLACFPALLCRLLACLAARADAAVAAAL